MHFQWYPGHMTKAKRMMQENIKLIDLIIELVDARVPLSSRNPDIDELGKNKARLIILNKSDLAEERWNEAWTEYFKTVSYTHLPVGLNLPLFQWRPIGGEKQAGISGGVNPPADIASGRIAEVRSRSMSCNCMTRISQQEC